MHGEDGKDPLLRPAGQVNLRVSQRRSAEDYLRAGLTALLAVFLQVFVLLPLGELFLAASNGEVFVAVWSRTEGAEDVRIGSRVMRFADGKMLVDGHEAAFDGKIWQGEGITARRRKSGLFLSAHELLLQGEACGVRPVTVEILPDGQALIDGQALTGEEYGREVRRWIGLHRFHGYFANPGMVQSLYHSLVVGVLTTVIAVVLAFIYAYGLTRTCMPAKTFFRVVAMLPLFAPTMLYGLSLVYLFGNQGVITTGFFDHPWFAWLRWNIDLYGLNGIVISEVIYTFPPALMILVVALSNTDARLYEAARSLGAGGLRTFLTVTLPGVKYGLISAVFVCFTLSFTDFGAPKIVGGQYNVLAVDIYKQVVGQHNLGMGATVSIVLLIPAVLSFLADRLTRRRQSAAITAHSKPLIPKPARAGDTAFLLLCGLIALGILAMLFTAGIGSLFAMWPYDFSLSLKHYQFKGFSGGYEAYINSVIVSALSAIIGTAITFGGAYLVEKGTGLRWLRQSAYLLGILPLALPGLVIGIAYIFFFNRPYFEIPLLELRVGNPLHLIYGTLWILVICNIIHFFTVGLMTCTTALRQLDKEFEQVSASLAVPFYVTFCRVTIPICLPAILETALYLFVSSMATVSAVIFLYSPDTRLASVAVVNMSDAGDDTAASAMCMLIVLTNIAVRLVFELASWLLRRRGGGWRAG